VEIDLPPGRVEPARKGAKPGRRQRLEYERGRYLQAKARDRPEELTPEQVQQKFDRLDAGSPPSIPVIAAAPRPEVKDAGSGSEV
jgi:hypothetical protein